MMLNDQPGGRTRPFSQPSSTKHQKTVIFNSEQEEKKSMVVTTVHITRDQLSVTYVDTWMKQETFFSTHFGRKHSVAGHNVHCLASQKAKTKWFVYLEECVHPEGIFQYIGLTDLMTH